MKEQTALLDLKRYAGGQMTSVQDAVAVEEPLYIELVRENRTGKIQSQLALTMRTPGHDAELAAGYLLTEGIVKFKSDIRNIRQSSQDSNRLEVFLSEKLLPDFQKASRSGYISSACGICGKTGVEDLMAAAGIGFRSVRLSLKSRVLISLQSQLRIRQSVFESTGGIHAAALFDEEGGLIAVREDVGRHNALDKLIGHALMHDMIPASRHILLLSGRAGFELIQKAAMAGIPVVAAVGAPSSLAIEAARDMHITLIGFLRDDRFNIYTEFDSFE